MKKLSLFLFLLITLVMVFGAASQATAGPLPGAIFTTLVDGSRVNANIYLNKEDVYLDGGPGPNAPSTAAGLPEGDYYFQVTDPSGKVLLSTDPVRCRKFHVNGYGVIDLVYPATCTEKRGRNWVEIDCTHLTGIDKDHFELGAITIQLMPYNDTPNKGGVYKVWVTPVGQFAGNPDLVDNGYSPGYYHGFIPGWSKTDNFKAKKKQFVPPIITVRKFHDKNINGIKDAEEEDITGWMVDVTEPLDLFDSVTSTLPTPITYMAALQGDYLFEEDRPAGTLQTVSYLDGLVQSLYPTADPKVTVSVAMFPGETHEVVYGNVGLGSITACKVYDRNGNRQPDPDEPTVSGWRMQLEGTTVKGDIVGPIYQYTEDGCTTFEGLLPGNYTVTEIQPLGGCWEPNGQTSYDVVIKSSLVGSNVVGTSETVKFTNICKGYADFGTKGYWHNKNGLSETTQGDLDYLNSLLPWKSPSSYFDAGDEPIDGYFADGSPVAAANGEWGETIAPAGSPFAEQSHFLIDANAGGDPREQLAQQLDAFVMNSLHRLDSADAMIQLPNGNWIRASDLIGDAVEAWESGDANAMQELLNALNESDSVPFIHYYPCEVIYGTII